MDFFGYYYFRVSTAEKVIDLLEKFIESSLKISFERKGESSPFLSSLTSAINAEVFLSARLRC